MRTSTDVTAAVLGLLALLLAGLGLWDSFGKINWSVVGLAAPISLVVVGLLGLALSKPKS